MKTIAYTALHYGSDYLASAIRSVIDSVDQYWVLYTAVGSHGSRTSVPCPDTKDELYAIAQQAAGSKLHWRSSEWGWEGQQRDSIHSYVPDADVILVLDADEIWSTGLAERAVRHMHGDTSARWRMPMIHYWRSFYRAIVRDPAYPERLILPKNAAGTKTFPVEAGVIHHLGYAQRAEIVEYKQLTHGHRGEWRKDDWFNTIFMTNRQYDTHPVGSQYWSPEDVDPFALGLPEFMRSHPYANLALIP